MKQKILLLFLLLTALPLCAQIEEPVKWKTTLSVGKDNMGVVTMTATIGNGWHMYAINIPDGGPVPLTISWSELKGVELVGKPVPDRKAHTQHDNNFDMDLSWWTGGVKLTQKVKFTSGKYSMKGTLRYMSCNDVRCTSPATEPLAFSGTAAVGTESQSSAVVADTLSATDTVAAALTPAAGIDAPDTVGQAQLWAPVGAAADLAAGEAAGSSTASWWYIFIACFAGGLLALLTPCVWPIIPLTMSFFLKKSGSRGKAIANAVAYGLSIIVIYLALGLVVTAISGADSLNALATNAVCNVVFFLLLVVFAFSFFGMFNIKLPDSWSNKVDSAAERTTGLLSIFFMAFTLVIVSFSCTGPIIGTLLVEAASTSNILGPAVGMFAFALALAIPFSLFAMFPSLLKKLPKSGGWLNTVKVLLGFIELALSLKFLSVADLAYGWHVLDRETFLALWIGIFFTMGLYLLGVFRFKADSAPQGIGVVRYVLALVSLSFTAYLLPGLWGAPLRATSAFVPPLYTQDFNLHGEELSEYNDFDAGMKAAAKLGKLVLLDFSGYGCVNCRKMDGAVLDKSEVKRKISENFVVIKLMVDDKAALAQPMYVVEDGRQKELATVGEKWSYLQRHKFGANSQPYYVVLNADGNLMSGPFAYKESVDEFMQFLDRGISNYKK